jgi:hypothetical protein
VEVITKMISSSEDKASESESESNCSSQRTGKKTFTIKTSVKQEAGSAIQKPEVVVEVKNYEEASTALSVR